MLLAAPGAVFAQDFELEEATIAEVHAAFLTGELTCVELVQGYLARIEAYDEQGPRLNTIANLNPAALDEAARFDQATRRRRTHRTAALHPGPPQGPGRDPRHAHHLRVGALCGLRVLPGRHHRHPHEGRGRAHHRQDQHGRVRIALRGLGLRLHPQPLRSAAQSERLFRGDGRGRGREPGNDRHRRGHRRLHPRPVGGARAGRAQAPPCHWSAATA